MSSNQSVSYEVFGENGSGPLLIVLHGSSGPDVPLYRQQALYFASNGYTVLYLHFFDSTGSTVPSDANYNTWVTAVSDLVRLCNTKPNWVNRKIALLGFSLGASVALAAGSQSVPVSAVVDWYGSLPDEFFYRLKGMPPLLILHGGRDQIIPVTNAQQLMRLCGMEHFKCESHIYQDQGHGFIDQALKDADNRSLEFLSRTMH